MRKVAIPLAILALIGLDQWVKHWVVANIALNQVIKAIPGLFSLTYLQNRGAAFSILQDQKYFFVILTVLVIGAALVSLVGSIFDFDYLRWYWQLHRPSALGLRG